MDTAGTRIQPLQAIFRDGLGTRHLLDGAGGRLEVLALRQHLTAVSTFEFLLRERVTRLAQFRQPCYAHVRYVERGGAGASMLAVVSDHVPGVRLSRMLALAEQNLLPLDVDSALCLIRQLVSAVASLHEAAPDASHGALAPERIVITPDAHLVIVEHVLGAALEQLQYSSERYWTDLRIALPPAEGEPRFTRRTDVVQTGAVALALLLGRPIGEDEYPASVSELATGTFGLGGGFEPLPQWLQNWLSRALWLDPPHAFTSGVDARQAFESGLAGGGYTASQASLESFVAQYHTSIEGHTPEAPLPSPRSPLALSPALPMASPAPLPAVPAPNAAISALRAFDEEVDVPEAVVAPPLPRTPPPATTPFDTVPPAPPPVALSMKTVIEETPVALLMKSGIEEPPHMAPSLKTLIPEPSPAPPAVKTVIPMPPAPAAMKTVIPMPPPPAPAVKAAIPTPPPAAPALKTVIRAFHHRSEEADVPNTETGNIATVWNSRRARVIAAAVVLVALTSGGTMAARRYLAAPPVSAPTMGTLAVHTDPAGAVIVVDGEQRGVTPLRVSLNAGPHTLELSADGVHRTVSLTIAANAEVSQFIEMPKAAPAVGQLEVRTDPSGAKVSVDGQARGVSPLTVTGLAPGRHVVMLENQLGSVDENVNIEPGNTATLVVPLRGPQGAPVSGWISITAPAEVQVFENQRLLGSSRTDRIMVTAGRHDLEIVNESLGYRSSETIQVAPGQVAKVKPDWPQGTIAINAAPWANVWLDGEELGETPVGSTRVPIGTHEVVFRHPQFGEQHYTTTVTAATPARLSVDMRKK